MRLRKLKQIDAALMIEWMHDEFVVCNLKANFTKKTIEDCKSFIDAAQNFEKNIHLAISDNEDTYMGTVSLKNIKNDTAEFGIVVRRDAMGKGYSLYAMKEIIKYGFDAIGLKKIYWCVSLDNKRACRFYDKNGYVKCIIPPEEAEGYNDDEVKKLAWYMIVRDSSCGENV